MCRLTQVLIAATLLGAISPASPTDRKLLYREIHMAALYSGQEARLDFHPAPLYSSAGLEYLWKSGDERSGRWNADALDLYIQTIYDPKQDRIEVRFQDAWIRFLEPSSGLKVRLGRVSLPYGLNPVAEPRGETLQPLGAFDLGFKRDWGIALQTEWRQFSLETAATLGMAHDLRRQRGSHLWSGRIGLPTYRDVQYGISMLFGNVAHFGRARHLQRRWRMAGDLVYMYHEPFTVIKAELVFGDDETTPVGGMLVGLTQILPSYPLWGIETQVRLWNEDRAAADAVRAQSTIGIWRSLPRLLTLRLHWRHHVSSDIQPQDDRLFAQLYYYGY